MRRTGWSSSGLVWRWASWASADPLAHGIGGSEIRGKDRSGHGPNLRGAPGPARMWNTPGTTSLAGLGVLRFECTGTATICFEKLKRFSDTPPDVPGPPLLACGDHGLPLEPLDAFKSSFRNGKNGRNCCSSLRISGGNPELDSFPFKGTTLNTYGSVMKHIGFDGQVRVRLESLLASGKNQTCV